MILIALSYIKYEKSDGLLVHFSCSYKNVSGFNEFTNEVRFEHYWEVFNPYKIEESLAASLSDVILDIKDVKKEYFCMSNENLQMESGNGNLA